MKTVDAPAMLKPYVFHGVDITPGEAKASGDCPFCEKANHFGVIMATGQYKCVRCEEKGNIATFIQRIHTLSMERINGVPATYYRDLLKEKPGLDPDVLRDWGVCRSYITGDWLIPAWNAKGKLSNLHKIVTVGGNLKALSTPSCKLHPFGPAPGSTRPTPFDKTGKALDSLWVCEGPWDGIALDSTLRSIAQRGPGIIKTAAVDKTLSRTQGVIAVPGSGNFNPAWLELFHKRTIRLCFDNDYPKTTPAKKTIKPGWDGMQRVIDAVAAQGRYVPYHIHRMTWGKGGYTKDLADGYDVRDVLTAEGPVKGYQYLVKHCKKVPQSVLVNDVSPIEERPLVEVVPCNTFADLITCYGEVLYLTRSIKDTLAVMLASVVSTSLKSDQVWLRVIGPPGSCKSTLAEAISASADFTLPMSLQTGFHSGYTGGGRGKNAKDTSLIPEMDGRAVIIKDGDTLLTSPSRDRILAELRDIYDGTSRARYRNGKVNNYTGIQTVFIICGTNELHQLDKSSLGERFLNVNIFEDTDREHLTSIAVKSAINNVSIGFGTDLDTDPGSEQSIDDDKLKGMTVGYLNHLKISLAVTRSPTMSAEQASKIESLGNLTAYMRANVDRDRDGIKQRPTVELGTRLGKQFTKLALVLAYVKNKPTVDDDIMRIVIKVAHDTCHGFQFEITRLLYRYHDSGMTAEQIELKVGLSGTSVRRLLDDMRELKIVRRDNEPNKSGQRGRNRHMWRLTADLYSLHTVAFPSKRKPTPAKTPSTKRRPINRNAPASPP